MDCPPPIPTPTPFSGAVIRSKGKYRAVSKGTFQKQRMEKFGKKGLSACRLSRACTYQLELNN